MKPEDIIHISKRIARTMYATYFKKMREACSARELKLNNHGKDLAGVLEDAFENALVNAVTEALNSAA